VRNVYAKSLFVLTIVTIIYLVYELSFNVKLLEVVGQLSEPDEVHHIEVTGRIISGFAGFLAVFSFGYKRIARNGFPAFWGILLLAVLVGGGIYYGEEKLIDCIADNSSGEERKSTIRSNYVNRLILSGDISLKDVDISKENIDSPATKTFFALFPFFASNLENFYEKTDGLIKKRIENDVKVTVKKKVKNIVKSNKDIKVPTLEACYKKYISSLNYIKKIYNDKYFVANEEYIKKMERAVEKTHEAWDMYFKEVKLHFGLREEHDLINISPESKAWKYYLKRLRHAKLPLSRDYKPSDKQGFYDAIFNFQKKKISKKFNDEVSKVLGSKKHDIKPNMPWEEFYKSNTVQRIWKDKLHLTHYKNNIPDGALMSWFEKAIYHPYIVDSYKQKYAKSNPNRQIKNTISLKTKKAFDLFSAPVSEYEDGGKYADAGVQAYKAMIVPPIALAFSLIGGIFHLCKLSFYLLTFCGLPKKIKIFFIVIVLCGFVYFPFGFTNNITESVLYEKIHSDIDKNKSFFVSRGTDWLIRLKPYTYKANSRIREKLCVGFDFCKID
jgi:hypothetical protein